MTLTLLAETVTAADSGVTPGQAVVLFVLAVCALIGAIEIGLFELIFGLIGLVCELIFSLVAILIELLATPILAFGELLSLIPATFTFFQRLPLMYLFNAFQMTACFAAAPFGIAWLADANFPWARAAFWVALVAYVIFFGMMVAAVYNNIDTKSQKRL